MDEAERRRFDELEANGFLPRLRLRVKSFAAPLWWEAGGNRVLGNGTMCVVKTPDALFGVTANHVLSIYQKHKAAEPDTFCQLGSGPFDPVENLLARSEHWDLATFRVPPLTLRHWQRQVFVADEWPPAALKQGDPIILGGYPENRRSQGPGPKPATMTADFVSLISRADKWSENHMAFCFDSSSWYWPQGKGLNPNPELSGASGGPCFRLVPEQDRIELSGFIYEAHTAYELIRVRQAHLISPDGTIAPAPLGVRPLVLQDES